MVEAFIALGSNVGDRAAHLRAAIEALTRIDSHLLVSPFYETAPVGYLDQGPFLNGVVRIETGLDPAALLRALLAVEVEHGRVRDVRNGPRTLDLDLILYGDLVFETPELVVPHPRLQERAFVLVPLCDLAPERVHPVSGATMRELLARLGPHDYRRVLIDAS